MFSPSEEKRRSMLMSLEILKRKLMMKGKGYERNWESGIRFERLLKREKYSEKLMAIQK